MSVLRCLPDHPEIRLQHDDSTFHKNDSSMKGMLLAASCGRIPPLHALVQMPHVHLTRQRPRFERRFGNGLVFRFAQIVAFHQTFHEESSGGEMMNAGVVAHEGEEVKGSQLSSSGDHDGHRCNSLPVRRHRHLQRLRQCYVWQYHRPQHHPGRRWQCRCGRWVRWCRRPGMRTRVEWRSRLFSWIKVNRARLTSPWGETRLRNRTKKSRAKHGAGSRVSVRICSTSFISYAPPARGGPAAFVPHCPGETWGTFRHNHAR